MRNEKEVLKSYIRGKLVDGILLFLMCLNTKIWSSPLVFLNTTKAEFKLFIVHCLHSTTFLFFLHHTHPPDVLQTNYIAHFRYKFTKLSGCFSL